MTEQQTERLLTALEQIAKSTQVSAVMAEDQLSLLSDIHRRLAEMNEQAEKIAGKTKR